MEKEISLFSLIKALFNRAVLKQGNKLTIDDLDIIDAANQLTDPKANEPFHKTVTDNVIRAALLANHGYDSIAILPIAEMTNTEENRMNLLIQFCIQNKETIPESEELISRAEKVLERAH